MNKFLLKLKSVQNVGIRIRKQIIYQADKFLEPYF